MAAPQVQSEPKLKKKRTRLDDEKKPLKADQFVKENMSNEEFLIHQDEHRKACINQLLKSKLGDNILTDQIKSDTWTERLLRSPPASIDCDKLDKIMVVEDNVEQYPQFYKILYCSLDYSLVLLYTMLFLKFEHMWGGNGNPMLSIFLIYLCERALRYIRKELSKKNLC